MKQVLDGEIDFESMRIKLEFAFRLLTQLTRRLANDQQKQYHELNEKTIADFLSLLVTQAAAIIYHRRRKNLFSVSEAEFDNMKKIALAVINKFNAMQLKICNETNGLPISLAIVQEETVTLEGIDELMNDLKLLLNLHQ